MKYVRQADLGSGKFWLTGSQIISQRVYQFMVCTWSHSDSLHTGHSPLWHASILWWGGLSAQWVALTSVPLPARHFIDLIRVPSPQLTEHCNSMNGGTIVRPIIWGSFKDFQAYIWNCFTIESLQSYNSNSGKPLQKPLAQILYSIISEWVIWKPEVCRISLFCEMSDLGLEFGQFSSQQWGNYQLKELISLKSRSNQLVGLLYYWALGKTDAKVIVKPS